MDKNQKELIEVKVILLGNSAVGKTNLIKVVTNEKFNECETPTSFTSFKSKNLKINSINYSLNLWEILGNGKYRDLSDIFFKGTDIAIFVYDITNKESFDDLISGLKNLKTI